MPTVDAKYSFVNVAEKPAGSMAMVVVVLDEGSVVVVVGGPERLVLVVVVAAPASVVVVVVVGGPPRLVVTASPLQPASRSAAASSKSKAERITVFLDTCFMALPSRDMPPSHRARQKPGSQSYCTRERQEGSSSAASCSGKPLHRISFLG